MKAAKRTPRGFRTYKPIKTSRQRPCDIRLVESSLATREPHLWLFVEGECYEHMGQHERPSPHLSLRSVKQLARYLYHWIGEKEEELGR